MKPKEWLSRLFPRKSEERWVFPDIQTPRPRFLEYFLDEKTPLLLDESGEIRPGSVVFMKNEAYPAISVMSHQNSPEGKRWRCYVVTGTHMSGMFHVSPIVVDDDYHTLRVYQSAGESALFTNEMAHRLLNQADAKSTDLIFAVIHPEVFRGLNTRELTSYVTTHQVGDNTVLHIDS